MGVKQTLMSLKARGATDKKKLSGLKTQNKLKADADPSME